VKRQELPAPFNPSSSFSILFYASPVFEMQANLSGRNPTKRRCNHKTTRWQQKKAVQINGWKQA
jgi:hypothetical protein